MNAVSQNLIFTTNVRRDMDRADLIVSQIHNFLAPNTNNVVVGFGHDVVSNAFMDWRQARDDAVLFECI